MQLMDLQQRLDPDPFNQLERMNNQFTLPTAFIALLLTLGLNATAFGQCAEGQSQVVVEILTDNFPQEITWTLTGADGQLMSGGPYGESGTLYADTVCIDGADETPCLAVRD